MSKYMSFESEAFANRELLIEALKEMGFENVTVGTDLLLQGYDKRDRRLADVVIRRESVKSHRLLGDIGLHVGEDEAELGITLAADAQGRGLATEAAEAVVAGLRAHTGVRRLVGITDVRNTSSARLLERLGMELEREHDGEWYYAMVL